MLFAEYLCNDYLDRIKTLLGVKKDKREYFRIKSIMLDLIVVLNEMIEYDNSCSEALTYKTVINNCVSTITEDNMIDNLELIHNSMDLFLNIIEGNKISNVSYDSSYNKDTFERQAFCSDDFKKIINFPTRNINTICIYARKGVNVGEFKKACETNTVYGISEECTSQCRKSVDNVATGFGKGSRISNGVFDINYVIPNIAIKAPKVMISTSFNYIERYDYVRTLDYSRDNGIVIVSIPYFKLGQKMCTALSKSLRDVKVFRTSKKYSDRSYNSWNSSVLIVGYKNKNNENYKVEYDTLRKCGLSYNKAIDICEYNGPKYEVLNNVATEVKQFTGARIDMEEIERSLISSKYEENVFSYEDVSRFENKKPLLPFSVGQIGLVLCSGCLDGIVEEDDKGNSHLIKGMVTKDTSTSTSRDGGSTTVEKITSNKVQINVLTPNGEFIELA